MRALAAWLLLPAAAWAHGGGDGEVAWSFDPWVLAPLLLSAALYEVGAARIWRRAGAGRGISRWQAVCYASGWLALAAALVSPLHWLGRQLFAAHMIEHEVVMAVAAPLLVLGRPLGALVWALPPAARRALGGLGRAPVLQAVWGGLTRPVNATVLHGLAIWGWHVPAAFDAALASPALHRLQHLCFLLTALLFWWVVLRRRNRATAAVHLLATMVHTSLLGVLLTFAPRVLYAVQTARSNDWGLAKLEDQQLAGLVMWIPAGTVYGAASLACVALWLRHTAWQPSHAQ